MLDEMRNEVVLNLKKEFALRMISRGKDTLEEIAEVIDLPLEEVTLLAKTREI